MVTPRGFKLQPTFHLPLTPRLTYQLRPGIRLQLISMACTYQVTPTRVKTKMLSQRTFFRIASRISRLPPSIRGRLEVSWHDAGFCPDGFQFLGNARIEMKLADKAAALAACAGIPRPALARRAHGIRHGELHRAIGGV